MARFSPTLDINTGLTTVDGTAPGESWSPPRYTTTAVDTVRVLAWSVLSTESTRYALDQPSGLDWLAILDSRSTDAERSAIVSEVVLGLPGVTGLVSDPTVVVLGSQCTITFTARVGSSEFTLTLGS